METFLPDGDLPFRRRPFFPTETFLSDGDLPEIDSCYAGTSDLTQYVEEIIYDIENIKIFEALEAIELFIFHFQLDLQPCMHMSEDIQAIKDWAMIFTDVTKLIETVTEHYLLHGRKIKADIDDFKTSEAAGNYFQAGSDIADIVVQLLGPVQQPTPAPAFLQ